MSIDVLAIAQITIAKNVGNLNVQLSVRVSVNEK